MVDALCRARERVKGLVGEGECTRTSLIGGAGTFKVGVVDEGAVNEGAVGWARSSATRIWVSTRDFAPESGKLGVRSCNLNGI